MTASPLPRLLVLGDVPVESTYHGSALLYRLLETYPPDRVRVIESASAPSRPERRLKSVYYATLDGGSDRLLHSRLHAWWSLWLSLSSGSWASRVPSLLGDFAPGAVVTVAHGYRWVTAARFAEARGLPLHLIVHDDWPRTAQLPVPFGQRVERQFGPIYRAAASRLCVSPYLEEEYERRYGVRGVVLYPSRARDARAHRAPPDRVRERRAGLTLAFAGTINTPEYYRVIGTLARSLQAAGGRVLVFGPMTAAQGRDGGLDQPNVEFCGLVESGVLMERLRAEADVLLVPMSFAAVYESNMKISFPSKLTDYTAVGLPLLITGPDYSSAVRWARENPGVAEVVDSPDDHQLIAATDRLAADPEYRYRLAARALEVGERMFGHRAAWALFSEQVSRPRT